MKIRLAKLALRDFRELQAYIAMDNPQAALRVAATLRKSIELIGEQPNIGRADPETAFREWAVPGLPYVIPYRILGETIEIVRIYHTSRKRPVEW